MIANIPFGYDIVISGKKVTIVAENAKLMRIEVL
jgi:hypothetical protein